MIDRATMWLYLVIKKGDYEAQTLKMIITQILKMIITLGRKSS
jgi:hypothetical protein